MNKTHWMTVLGLIVSFSLIGVVLPRLDWPTFSLTLRSVNVLWVATTAVGIAAGVLVRSLRWNLISGFPLSQYSNFWRAASLGYLGNMVCPARAGELLRMMAIQRFAHMPVGQAVISAVIDRVADGLALGVFLVIAIVYGGLEFPGSKAIIGVVGLFGFAGFILAAFIRWGGKWHHKVMCWTRFCPALLRERLTHWYTQAFEGVQTLRIPSRLVIIAALTIAVFLMDSAAIWVMMMGFGWVLPFMAAAVLEIMIAVGTTLPSAPGYIGIYQVVCVLTLGMYGIDESSAAAFSIVLQLLIFCIFLVQGVCIVIGYGYTNLRLSFTAEEV